MTYFARDAAPGEAVALAAAFVGDLNKKGCYQQDVY
jgi:hypothetical protein